MLNDLKDCFRLYCCVVVGVMWGTSAIAASKTIRDSGVHTIGDETSLQVLLSGDDEKLTIKMDENSNKHFVGGTSVCALNIVRGDVTLEIPKGYMLRCEGSEGNPAITIGHPTYTDYNASLTVTGEGDLLAVGRTETAISSAISNTAGRLNTGKLILDGDVNVFATMATTTAETTTAPPCIRTLKSVQIKRGALYCHAMFSTGSYLDVSKFNPYAWISSASSTNPPIVANEVILSGGALLGSKCISAKAFDMNARITYTGEIANFTWTGGSYAHVDAQVYVMPEGMTSLPGACITFGEGKPCTGTFLASETRSSTYGGSAHLLYLPEGATTRLTVGDALAKELFNLGDEAETVTEDGFKVDYTFGILGLRPTLDAQNELAVELTVGVQLPNTSEDTATFKVNTYEREGEGTPFEVYSGNITFTRSTATSMENLFTATFLTSAPFDRENAPSTRTFTVSAQAAETTAE